jgi:hypothetical protein
MRRGRPGQQGRGALDIIEEATHLLRLLPARILACYYVGALPFVLGFLYFWADMSQSAFARERLEGAAFTLSLAFVWMKCWHSVYAARLTDHVCGGPSTGVPFIRKLRVLVVQAAVQPTGFVVLPLALLITLPFGWVYAFYQNVSVFGGGGGGIREVVAKSWRQARLYPGQNHMALFIMLVFGMFVFFNAAVAIYLVPQLLKMFFGMETAFTRAGWNMLNTTLLAVSSGVSYLLLDPLVKTVYVLRCFYGQSLRTGEDLKVELQGLRTRAGTALGLMVLSLALLGTVVRGEAFADGQASTSSQTGHVAVAAPELDRSISEVLSRREYGWRMPRQKAETKRDGLCAAFLGGVHETLGEWLRPAAEWLRRAMDWIAEKLFRRDGHAVEKKPAYLGAKRILYFLIYLLIAASACTLVLVFVREWRRRRSAPGEAAPGPKSILPDITKEEITADEFSTNRWLELARELMEEGEARLALRALYLGSLSHLARIGLITVAAFKSNRDYERELWRKAHTMPDLLSAFAQNVRIFESIWYGMHDVTTEVVRRFDENQRRVMAFAEE